MKIIYLDTAFYLICAIAFLSCSNIRHAAEYINTSSADAYTETFDTEGLLFSQKKYDSSLGRYSTIYYSRNGDTLVTNNYYLKTDIIKSIQAKLSSELENDDNCLSGQALLYIMYDPDRDIKEIRLLRGFDSQFNSRLVKIIKAKEQEMLNSIAQTTAVVTVFPLKLGY